MKKMNVIFRFLMLTILSSCHKDDGQKPTGETDILYTMPEESETHEGTWLLWPHHYQYGMVYQYSLDAAWVSMTKELVSSEKVPKKLKARN